MIRIICERPAKYLLSTFEKLPRISYQVIILQWGTVALKHRNAYNMP